MNNLSENLKKIRKEYNLSQEQLAEKLGVSRQSVSKWESSQAYPEMDKLVQISKLYNIDLNDLINNDISEVNKKESSINKYTTSFIEFITDTINMFLKMNFKSKIKCVFEQIIVILFLYLFFTFFRYLGQALFDSLFYLASNKIYFSIYKILDTAYVLVATLMSIFITVHIFKTRYLNYYICIEEDQTNDKSNEKKLFVDEKRDKIILRDPKHSEYNVLSFMAKCILVLIKFMTLFLALLLCITLITFGTLFILSFVIIKTKLVFLGLIICSISCIVINSDILILLFNFILNKQSNKKALIYTFVAALILFGIGCGIFSSGITKFDYIDVSSKNSNVYLEDTYYETMNDSLIISDNYHLYNLDYKEEDRNDIKIVIKHTKLVKTGYFKDANTIYFTYEYNSNKFELLRDEIKYINEMKFVNYSDIKITIYASKDNINKLKENANKFIDEE